MKEKMLRCEHCKEETRHLVGEKNSTTRTGYRRRREIKHCTECNKRTIKNMKMGRTYVKDYNKGVENES